jgi:FHS family L-fucose permease-like MFS transporter
MSIVGGAILPRVFGLISDSMGDIQFGYIVPLCCFVVVAYFGWQSNAASRGPASITRK